MSKCELIIQNGSSIQQCAVEEGIVWETARRKTVGKLTFTVLKDEALGFHEGNPVTFKYGGNKIFFGFVFTKERSNNDKIKVTAYDQLRYLKNKDTCIYENKTATQVLQLLARDFQLNLKQPADTKYVIPSAAEENKELFEIIQNALDVTTQATAISYVLFDDFGDLRLVSLGDMKLDILIDEASGESFSYTSSIDTDTYNRVKLIYEDKDKGKREVFIAQDTANQNRWGVLQYFEQIQSNKNARQMADTLLKQYNQKTRKLTVNKALGDVRVRGGSVLPIQLYLGDISVANYMIVESVKHTFKESEHTMAPVFVGGEFGV